MSEPRKDPIGNFKGDRVCVACGNDKMGARAKYCNCCGTVLPPSRYEPSIDEIEADAEWYEEIGGRCGKTDHLIIAGAARSSGALICFCPHCGRKVMETEL